MKKILFVIGLLLSTNGFADRDGWRGGNNNRGNSSDSGDYRGGGGHGWRHGYSDSGRADWNDGFRGGYRHGHHPHRPMYPNYGSQFQNNCRFDPYNGVTVCPPPPPRYLPPQFNFVVPFPRW